MSPNSVITQCMRKRFHFAMMQKPTQKDVEKGFRVLQAKFAIT
jgi:hypothetical protein